MKKWFLALPLLAWTGVGAHAQGYVIFANVDQDITVEKRIFDTITLEYLDSNYVAQLYAGVAGSTEAALVPVDVPAVFLDSPEEARGEFIGNEVAIPGVNPGQNATLQVRVWRSELNGVYYPTWNAAYLTSLNTAGMHVGTSTLFTVTTGSLGNGTEIVFNMPTFSIPVPEPSLLGLGAAGLGLLFLQRRS